MARSDGIVTVFTGGEMGQILMAKMLLEAEGIRFVTEGEGVQDLFGLGRAGGGYNLFTGPVKLRVAAENAPRAIEVLREMAEEDET
jgi:hypothetical protein